MEQGKLKYKEVINGKITEDKELTLKTNCNFNKAEIIFNFLNGFVNEVQDDPDIIKYYIPKTEIISAYPDGTFSTNTYYGELERECYDLEYNNIANIISIICTNKENTRFELHFTGRIDNDESYEFDLNIEKNKIEEEFELFDKFKKEFTEAYEQSAGAIDSYIDFFTNYAVDSNEKIFKILLDVLEDLKYDESFTDRKGAIEFLKNYYKSD